MDGAQIPLDAADRQAPFFPQRGDAAEHVDAQALAPQCHAVQLCWGYERRRHAGQVLAMKTCSVTCTGTTGNSMTSRVRWTQPPVRCVPQSGQLSTTCSTRWVGVMRRRAKPWRRCFLGCCCAGGWRPELDLRPGIRGGPPDLAWPSSSATPRSSRTIITCNSAMTACCCTMMAMRTSRLAVVRSISVSTPSI